MDDAELLPGDEMEPELTHCEITTALCSNSVHVFTSALMPPASAAMLPITMKAVAVPPDAMVPPIMATVLHAMATPAVGFVIAHNLRNRVGVGRSERYATEVGERTCAFEAHFGDFGINLGRSFLGECVHFGAEFTFGFGVDHFGYPIAE